MVELNGAGAPRVSMRVGDKNKRLAEELVPVGSLLSSSLYLSQEVDESRQKVFFMHGLNAVTLPAFIESSSPHVDHTIDVYALLRCIYRESRPRMLDEIVDEYVRSVQRDTDQTITVTEELTDELFGILIHSQAASPIASLCGYAASWNSRSLVPKHQSIDDVMTDISAESATVYNLCCANPDMSMFDLFDATLSGQETRAESDHAREVFAVSVDQLLRAGAVWVNVPSKLYNQ